jgi:DNA (cytosine-5)-methyltransferase 1
MSSRARNVIDLFCGAGGMSAGFNQAGFNILLGIDVNPIYVSTFATNHPESKVLCTDLRSIEGKSIKRIIGEKNIHVVIGGPPCQSFSIARKRDPKDSRNTLPQDFLRIVKEIRPEWFVCENVVGILSSKSSNGNSIKNEFVETAHKIGYKTSYKILNAANFGVPQARKRVIFIGTRLNKHVQFPTPNSHKTVVTPSLILRKNKVDKHYFFSKKLTAGFKRREKMNKKRGLGFKWQFLKIGEPSFTIPARYWKDGANALIKYRDGSIRKLTEIECAKIQGFPDGYIFLGNKREVYESIGNAVPPPLSKAIAENLF